MTEQALKTSRVCEADRGKQEYKKSCFFFNFVVEQMSSKAIKLNCVRKKNLSLFLFTLSTRLDLFPRTPEVQVEADREGRNVLNVGIVHV